MIEYIVRRTTRATSLVYGPTTLLKDSKVFGPDEPMVKTEMYPTYKEFVYVWRSRLDTQRGQMFCVPSDALVRSDAGSSICASPFGSPLGSPLGSPHASTAPFTTPSTLTPLTCPMCPTTFLSPSILNYHLETVHGIADEDSPPDAAPVVDAPSVPAPAPAPAPAPTVDDSRCPLCDAVFGSPLAVSYHVSTTHPEIDVPAPAPHAPAAGLPATEPPLAPFQCPMCRTTCAGQYTLAAHMADEHPDRDPDAASASASSPPPRSPPGFSDVQLARERRLGSCIMVATSPYLDPQGSSEVSVQQDELVVVRKMRTVREGWIWVAKADGSAGFVPAVFLVPATPDDQPGTASASTSTFGSRSCPVCFRYFAAAALLDSHMAHYHPTYRPPTLQTDQTGPDLSPAAHASELYGPAPAAAPDGAAAGADAGPLPLPPPVLLPESAITATSGGALGLWRGIQGDNNSCYLDATLFSLFAFCAEFDALLDTEAPLRPHVAADDAKAMFVPQLKAVLRNDVVTALRSRLFVSAETMLRWRLFLDKVWEAANDPSAGVCEEEDVIDFLNQLFTLLLPDDSLAPTFVSSETGGAQASSFFHILPPIYDASGELAPYPGGGPSVQALVDAYVASTNLVFGSPPPFVILQMPREFHSSVYSFIYPCGTLDVPYAGELAADAPPDAPPPLLTARLTLSAIICIDSSHFVSYNRVPVVSSAGMVESTWVCFDSMSDSSVADGSVPALSHVALLANSLKDPAAVADIVDRELAAHTGRRAYRYTKSKISVETKRVLADSYVCVYVRE